MNIIFISIIAMLAIYFGVAFSRLKICAICSAVSLTWLGLLVTYLFGLHQETNWLGILMGGSVVGLMYKLDSYWQKHNFSGIWFLKLSIVILGFLFVNVIINKIWAHLAWLIPLVVISGAIGLMLLHNNSKQNHVSSKLQDKLDHCCD